MENALMWNWNGIADSVFNLDQFQLWMGTCMQFERQLTFREFIVSFNVDIELLMSAISMSFCHVLAMFCLENTCSIKTITYIPKTNVYRIKIVCMTVLYGIGMKALILVEGGGGGG